MHKFHSASFVQPRASCSAAFPLNFFPRQRFAVVTFSDGSWIHPTQNSMCIWPGVMLLPREFLRPKQYKPSQCYKGLANRGRKAFQFLIGPADRTSVQQRLLIRP
jgi:hypothetical protein